MGFKREDGTFEDTCLDKVKPGETIFVLRAQDKLAPALVRRWAEEAVQHGCDPAKVLEAGDISRAMERWENRKFPD